MEFPLYYDSFGVRFQQVMNTDGTPVIDDGQYVFVSDNDRSFQKIQKDVTDVAIKASLHPDNGTLSRAEEIRECRRKHEGEDFADMDVPSLRHIIPMFYRDAYQFGHDESKKVKKMWSGDPPKDWPADVFFGCPNNGSKGEKIKPSKLELIDMIRFLNKRMRQNRSEQQDEAQPLTEGFSSDFESTCNYAVESIHDVRDTPAVGSVLVYGMRAEEGHAIQPSGQIPVTALTMAAAVLSVPHAPPIIRSTVQPTLLPEALLPGTARPVAAVESTPPSLSAPVLSAMITTPFELLSPSPHFSTTAGVNITDLFPEGLNIEAIEGFIAGRQRESIIDTYNALIQQYQLLYIVTPPQESAIIIALTSAFVAQSRIGREYARVARGGVDLEEARSFHRQLCVYHCRADERDTQPGAAYPDTVGDWVYQDNLMSFPDGSNDMAYALLPIQQPASPSMAAFMRTPVMGASLVPPGAGFSVQSSLIDEPIDPAVTALAKPMTSLVSSVSQVHEQSQSLAKNGYGWLSDGQSMISSVAGQSQANSGRKGESPFFFSQLATAKELQGADMQDVPVHTSLQEEELMCAHLTKFYKDAETSSPVMLGYKRDDRRIEVLNLAKKREQQEEAIKAHATTFVGNPSNDYAVQLRTTSGWDTDGMIQCRDGSSSRNTDSVTPESELQEEAMTLPINDKWLNEMDMDDLKQDFLDSVIATTADSVTPESELKEEAMTLPINDKWLNEMGIDDWKPDFLDSGIATTADSVTPESELQEEAMTLPINDKWLNEMDMDDLKQDFLDSVIATTAVAGTTDYCAKIETDLDRSRTESKIRCMAIIMLDTVEVEESSRLSHVPWEPYNDASDFSNNSPVVSVVSGGGVRGSGPPECDNLWGAESGSGTPLPGRGGDDELMDKGVIHQSKLGTDIGMPEDRKPGALHSSGVIDSRIENADDKDAYNREKKNNQRKSLGNVCSLNHDPGPIDKGHCHFGSVLVGSGSVQGAESRMISCGKTKFAEKREKEKTGKDSPDLKKKKLWSSGDVNERM